MSQTKIFATKKMIDVWISRIAFVFSIPAFPKALIDEQFSVFSIAFFLSGYFVSFYLNFTIAYKVIIENDHLIFYFPIRKKLKISYNEIECIIPKKTFKDIRTYLSSNYTIVFKNKSFIYLSFINDDTADKIFINISNKINLIKHN